MADPFFSIITASYNYGQTIASTLESVRCQKFADIEHIVIDGGSTDETLEVLNRFEKSYNLAWVSESDEGISDAMNKGIRLSRGTYILVIQADDCLISPSILCDLYEHIIKEEYDFYAFPIVYTDSRGLTRKFSPHRVPTFYFRFKNCFRSQGTFIHRAVFNRVGWFREDLAINMDYDLYYRAIQFGCRAKIGVVPVAKMGRDGTSSRPENTRKRIELEFEVQRDNERLLFWRTLQAAYRPIYSLYKFGWNGNGQHPEC